MKKLFILSVASVLLLTGCGATETMNCTYESTASNGSTQVSYAIDHEKDEIKKVRITYDYKVNATDNGANMDNGNGADSDRDMNGNGTDNTRTTTDDNDKHMDGVGTGTDGTTNDTNPDNDGIVDGVVGSAIDTIVGGVTNTILDIAGLRERHQTVQNTYGNIAGFSVQNTSDVDNNYKVTYVIDYDTITDSDLARFNLSRDLEAMRKSYVNQGFTCK